MRYLKYLMGGLVTAALVACGGGGGSSGTGSGGGGTGGTGGTGGVVAVANFYVYSDKTAITNTGSDVATVKVVTVDASNNIVAGATVAVSTDNDSVFTPTTGLLTDATGALSGTVGNGADKSDRDLTVSVAVNGIVKQTVIRVTGSKLTLQANPPNPVPGQSVSLTATLQDFSNGPIAGAPIALSGTVPVLQGQTITTSSAGVATTTFTAPTSAGVYTLSATGNGVAAADYQVQVFAMAGAVPAAVVPGGALPALAASPNVLSVNSAGSTTNKSTLRFLFLDSTNTPIPNVRVRFDDVTTGLPRVGASLSTGAQTSYTDTSGVVTTQYIPGQNNSPTNGVTIRACYSTVDFSSSTDCPAQISASLTVAGQALAISIGNDNLLEKGNGTYIKTFTVSVADSAGRAVAGAPVDISVDLSSYGKSLFLDPRAWCANEDANRNGFVDPGENVNLSVDSNQQPTLEPRKSDLLIRYADPAVMTTDASGILLIKVEYSQRMATWLQYRVRVTADVSGSQGLAERDFVTTFIAGDEVNGSFLVAPYGSGACNSVN